MTPAAGNRFRSSISKAERTVLDVSYFHGIVSFKSTHGKPGKSERRKCTFMQWKRWCETHRPKEVTCQPTR